ncbi:MAG: DUF2783 domain-containing protein [Burkholderiaceae bacterium]
MNDSVEPDFGQDRLGPNADDVFSALTGAHDGLSVEQSHRLNARLVLMMMNTIGDASTLQALFAQARSSFDQDEERGAGGR